MSQYVCVGCVCRFVVGVPQNSNHSIRKPIKQDLPNFRPILISCFDPKRTLKCILYFIDIPSWWLVSTFTMQLINGNVQNQFMFFCLLFGQSILINFLRIKS